MRTPSVSRNVAALALAATVLACTDDSTAPEGGGSYPVVHAVLNPSAATQWVLVEEALTGTVTIDPTLPYDPREPIVSGGGRPVSGALVRMVGPQRDMFLREIAFFTVPPDSALPGYVPDGRGRGVYFFLNQNRPSEPLPPGVVPPPDVMMRVGPGETWQLEIGWPDGLRTVRGETRIPGFAPLPGPSFAAVNRDRDTLVIDLPGPASAIGAARYLVRLATPYGPVTLFTDSARVRLAGSLVNIDAPGAPRAFQPGFVQNVEVAAVDRNYYDYYRTEGSPRGGSLQLSHLSGAGGLFGAYVRLGVRSVTVTADQEDPGEGAFARTTAPGDTLELYRDAGSRFSGQLRGGGAFARRGNLIGTLEGDQLRLALVSFQSVADTLATFSGQLQGNEITGRFDDEAQSSVFRRAP
jgi:hypothetical protein